MPDYIRRTEAALQKGWPDDAAAQIAFFRNDVARSRRSFRRDDLQNRLSSARFVLRRQQAARRILYRARGETIAAAIALDNAIEKTMDEVWRLERELRSVSEEFHAADGSSVRV